MTSPTLTLLHNRSSIAKLTEPAPPKDALESILLAGCMAPDHAYLRPTRYLVLTGDERAVLGDAFAAALLADDPQADVEACEKLQRKALRAPMIIVAISRTELHPKVPEIEQIESTAASVALMQVAIDALGYSSMWRSGAMAYHATVKQHLGLTATDHIVAFLYVGTADAPAKQRKPIDIKAFMHSLETAE